jgi:hypothetical protein
MGFLTRLLRGPLTARAREARSWKGRLEEVQRAELARMVRLARPSGGAITVSHVSNHTKISFRPFLSPSATNGCVRWSCA